MTSTKRIKKVFSTADQVIHLWANQSQTEARCKNAFFNGKSIWSYGFHYELGRIITYKGQRVAMINSRYASMTTNGQISSAKHAFDDNTVVLSAVDNDLTDVKGAMLKMQDELVTWIFDHFNSLKFHNLEYSQWEDDGDYSEQGKVSKFNRYCDLLGMKHLKLDISKDFIGLYNDHVKYRMLKNEQRLAESLTPEAIAKRAAAENRRAQKQVEKVRLDLNAWLAGGPLVSGLRDLEPQKIRISGNEVQTTRGASVPLTHAVRLLKMIELGKAKQGESVGHFKLSMVSGDLVKVGCHTFSLTEVKAVLTNKPALELVSNEQGA